MTYKLAPPDHARQITVRQLIEQLQALGPEMLDAYVETEGCDCEGPCSGAGLKLTDYVKGRLDAPHARVLLMRDDRS